MTLIQQYGIQKLQLRNKITPKKASKEKEEEKKGKKGKNGVG